MVEGVHEGFTKHLEMHGVGFRAALNKDVLALNIGLRCVRGLRVVFFLHVCMGLACTIGLSCVFGASLPLACVRSWLV